MVPLRRSFIKDYMGMTKRTRVPLLNVTGIFFFFQGINTIKGKKSTLMEAPWKNIN